MSTYVSLCRPHGQHGQLDYFETVKYNIISIEHKSNRVYNHEEHNGEKTGLKTRFVFH